MKIYKHKIKRYLLGVVAMCIGALATHAQTGNHVFEGAEAANFDTVDLATPGKQTWSTYRGATPGYFSAVGTASYASPADDSAHVDGYVKHYADAANQGFSFPVGSGTDYRALGVSGTRGATAQLGVAWIVGDPSGNLDPTAPNSGAHDVNTFGTGITKVSPVGQWDWQDLSNDAAGSTVTVSIPNLSTFDNADNLRLVGWDGTEWVNLSGTNGATGNTEDSDLSGTMIAGITALGIGAGEQKFDYGDGTAFNEVRAEYTDANNDGTPDGTGSVWLGTSVSADFADASNATATGDASGDDGFGLPPTTGGTIDHTITLSAAGATTAFYSVRFITSSGTINLSGSETFTAAGSTTVTLSPAALNGYIGTIDYRVVVASSAADAAAAITGTDFINGEIEDYRRSYTDGLPVELVYFTGEWQNEDAVLSWETASELNNSHFEVERSFDGERFENVGSVASQAEGGNSASKISYTFSDPSAKSITLKKVYYRLVQTDYDGASKVFGPVLLEVENRELEGISLFPVPAQNTVTVRTSSRVNGQNYTLTVVDQLGKIVQRTEVVPSSDFTDTVLDISALPSAVYWVQVQGVSTSMETQKFIKTN